ANRHTTKSNVIAWPPSFNELTLVSVVPLQHLPRRSEATAVDRLRLPFALFDNLQFLPQFYHATVGQDAAKVHAGVNHTVASQYGAGVNNGVATNFRAVADDRAEFCQTSRDVAIGRHHGDFAVIEFHVRENHARTQMGVVTED